MFVTDSIVSIEIPGRGLKEHSKSKKSDFGRSADESLQIVEGFAENSSANSKPKAHLQISYN